MRGLAISRSIFLELLSVSAWRIWRDESVRRSRVAARCRRQTKRLDDGGINLQRVLVGHQAEAAGVPVSPDRPAEAARLRFRTHIRKPLPPFDGACALRLTVRFHRAKLSQQQPAGSHSIAAGPPHDAIKVTGIVLKGAQGVIHELTGDDVDRARATQALYQAAGASADLNSRLPGLRKEIERILYQPSPTGSENDTVAAIMRAVGQHLGPKQ